MTWQRVAIVVCAILAAVAVAVFAGDRLGDLLPLLTGALGFVGGAAVPTGSGSTTANRVAKLLLLAVVPAVMLGGCGGLANTGQQQGQSASRHASINGNYVERIDNLNAYLLPPGATITLPDGTTVEGAPVPDGLQMGSLFNAINIGKTDSRVQPQSTAEGGADGGDIGSGNTVSGLPGQ